METGVYSAERPILRAPQRADVVKSEYANVQMIKIAEQKFALPTLSIPGPTIFRQQPIREEVDGGQVR